jgi:hypothetical protein
MHYFARSALGVTCKPKQFHVSISTEISAVEESIYTAFQPNMSDKGHDMPEPRSEQPTPQLQDFI